MGQVNPDWFDRYGKRFEVYRLPKKRCEQQALQLQIGQDGLQLLDAIYSKEAPAWLRELPSVGVMCQVWWQQYYIEGKPISWQAKAGKGFEVRCFVIDWEAQIVTCPQGRQSQSWYIH